MMRFLGLLVAVVAAGTIAEGAEAMDHRIDAVPEGYALQAYDDFGVEGRQPHLRKGTDTYLFTFGTHDNDAPPRARSAVFSYEKLTLVYDGLDAGRSYALDLTYATDQVYKRVQSLWANGVQLHPPIPLPKGKAIGVTVRIPAAVSRAGSMELEIRIHGEVNATVSEAALWSDGPPPANSLEIGSVWGLGSELLGQVADLRRDGVAGATVTLHRGTAPVPVARTASGPDGSFRFAAERFADVPPEEELRIEAVSGARRAVFVVPSERRSFTPVTYRPTASAVAGLEAFGMSLDGTWRLNPGEPEGGEEWHDVTVPGQWRQQGFEIPADRVVTVACDPVIPAAWDGCRIFLRFEAVHGGAEYRLNGHKLGTSERLFTPIEWEITEAARPGAPNRLEVRLKTDTVSERLSASSGYAFHNLGGIDRSVSLFALPPVHVANLRIVTDLDDAYRDAELRLRLTVDNPAETATGGLSLHATLRDPSGREIPLDGPAHNAGRLGPGSHVVELAWPVADPLKWSAETPHLYRLALELREAGRMLERIERTVGFREVEIKGSLVTVNGTVVKLAGACHHEIDPLTGRAATARHAERDVEMLKQANLNYIRTSHYPPVKELVEAAERIGMYLEVEAPFCWVAPTDDLENLGEILTPTTAMVDYYGSSPAVIIWSIANESHLNRAFLISNEMVKDLDPTRLTTFNHPFSSPEREAAFDLTNRHYVGMPYDEVLPDDPHPLIFGEYNFPICHEQTDVRINPGLRELWGHGHADPESEYAEECARSFTLPPLKPGTPPGAWTHAYESKRVAGGVIWASHDDTFYFPDGTHAGYSWVHGFWGLIDAWRRPKPEWWLAKMIYSPVHFPKRRVDFRPGQRSVRVPVENRYSFTDLRDLDIRWEIAGETGALAVALPPRTAGEITVPLPPNVAPGAQLLVRCTDTYGRTVTVAAMALGTAEVVPPPKPASGPPAWEQDDRRIVVRGRGFSLVIDKRTGDLDPTDPDHDAAILRFPAPHLTRYDFGDLAGPNSEPYEELPKAPTRVVEDVAVEELSEGLAVTVRSRWEEFAGEVTWVIDRDGMTVIRSRCAYTGHDTNVREIGVRTELQKSCDEMRWRRWSEWGVLPEDSISRTEGRAAAWRDGHPGADAEGVPPTWPWSQDQTELGTADFRGIKFHIREASLTDGANRGAEAFGGGKSHLRASMADESVRLYLISRCPLGQIPLKSGDTLTDEFTLKLLPGE